MRRITFFKTLLVAIVLVVGSFSSWGQVTLPNLDPINYTVGQGLQTQANWTTLNSGDNILISTGNLSYPGLVGSTGSKFTFDGAGIDAAKLFTQQTTGTVYYSFLLNITSLGSLNTTGGYFTGLNEGTGTSYGATVWLRSDGIGYDIGINPRTTAANTQWSSGTTSLNNTLLVVISYQIVSGLTNDVVKMWVNPSPGSTEPTPTLTTTNTGVDLVNLNRILIRQDGSTATPFIEMDELRIGTNWTDVTPAATVLAVDAPSFIPGSGNYINDQNVTLSTTTVGADIYYTTDGSTPDATKTKYVSSIPVNSTTTIKAVAIKSGMVDGINSSTYTFPTSVATIAALHAATTPGFYKLTGEAILTLKSTTRNAKYIQDATGAVIIDDASTIITTPYNLGDGITGLSGTTALYNGMLQFTPVADPGTATTTGNAVVPMELPLSELINNQGMLVKVKDVTITGTSNFAASTSYNMNASSSTVIRTQYADLDYIGKAIPAARQDITGVVLVYNTTAQLVPRSLADFVGLPTCFVAESTIPTLSANVGSSATQDINISGLNLTSDITITKSGTDAGLFSLSTSTVPQTAGTATNTVVTITYTPSALGSNTATLTLTSAGAPDVVRTINGSSSGTTGLATSHVSLNVSSINGNIVFTSAKGESIQIFNATGQRLIQKLAVEGTNSIPVSAKGVVLVKVGDRFAKVIL